MQGVVDHNGFFQQVTCEWPGSTHDSFVLKSTPLWHGYPLRDWLMVPYISPVNFSQERYKRSLSRGRVMLSKLLT
uniref:DDE Tnp4 domain-containing protein n=1 Tax=Ditylenchus dipsaci TaxID=166011 RepID=A0A915EUX4_9BILA